MTAQNNKSELPAGFTDITKRVTSTMAHRYSKMKIEDDSGNITFESIAFALKAQKAVDHILRHVVKHNGDYLTCFADNKPILGNDLETVVDACAMNTRALNRKMIAHVLNSAPLSFQRYQYCPGFPRFMSVDGATTNNTWHPVDRLKLNDSAFNRWVSSQEIAKAEVAGLLADGLHKSEVGGIFEIMSTPTI